MKTYVLIISRHFPKTHPRSGDRTLFYSKIIEDEKIHTIRNNYELWEKRFKKIDAGEAFLSVRYWEGLPYRSKQIELLKLDNTHGIGLEKLSYVYDGFFRIGEFKYRRSTIADNDGLLEKDFIDWFGYLSPGDEKAIIHFTPFRYELF